MFEKPNREASACTRVTYTTHNSPPPLPQICEGTLMPGTGRPWRTRVLHLGMILREALVGSSAGLDSVATSGLLTRPSMLPVRSANPIFLFGASLIQVRGHSKCK